MKLKPKPSVSPETIKRLLETARQALDRRDLKQGIEILERARSLAPGNPDILLQLGRAHGLGFDFAAAGNCFERAVHFSSQKTPTLLKAADLAYDFYNLELCERYLRRAAEQADATAKHWVNLARLYATTNRFPESAQCLEQAVQLDPAFPEIPFLRGKLERQAGHWDEAEKLYRSVLTTSKDIWLRVRCGYEFATVLDRQGRYDEAMTALIEAKAPFQAQAGSFRQKREVFNTHRRQVLAGMSGAVLQRWFDAGPQLEPARRLAWLCGHPRSGTTLLEQVLDAHPDIITAEEPRCFQQDILVPLFKTQSSDPSFIQIKLPTLENASTGLLRRLRENYFRSMEGCLGQPTAGRLLVDKNPEMSMLADGFPRVFPDAKLLVALRDPRDVCLSCFMQNLPRDIGLRRSSHLTWSDTVEQYTEEMTLWRTLAPLMPGHYLEVRYEDLVEDLETVARKTLEFLGVPWDPAVLRFHEQAKQKVFSMANYAEVSKPVYKRARQRWRNYEKYFEPYQEKLAPFVKAFGYE